MERLGVVSRLRRYPVKSMAGEDVERVFVAHSGVVGDRVYALVGMREKKDFPWLTARQRPRLLLYRPRFMAPIPPELPYPAPGAYDLAVVSPDGRRMSITDAGFVDLLRSDLQCDVELRFSERGMHDALPVSLIGEQTIEALARETRSPLDARRFRANLYVRWDDPAGGFHEESLLGRQVRIGDTLTLLVSEKDPRCKVIGVDPDTGESDPALLETVARRHGGCAGVYGVVVREGVAEAGAPIHLV